MVEYTSDQLDTIFQALADPTRRGMLAALAGGPSTISDLAEPHAMSLAAASKHVKKLETAGLIEREVVGRVHHCRLTPEALKAAGDWIKTYERFWTSRLDILEELLKAEDKMKDNEQYKKEGWGHANDE